MSVCQTHRKNKERINLEHGVPFHVQFAQYFSCTSFSLSLTVADFLVFDSFTFHTREEMNDFTLVGRFDWFECWILFLATHQNEFLGAISRAYRVRSLVNYFTCECSLFFQSFIFGSHLYSVLSFAAWKCFFIRWENSHANACRILMRC